MEGEINWLINPSWSLGVGVRWWHIITEGFSHFEETAGGGQPQPVHISQNSYGLLVQTNYQFNQGQNTPPTSWSGAFVGANVGYGTNPQTATIYPTSASAIDLQSGFNPASPQGISIQNAGFLGGGQIGYNWLIHNILLGAEADYQETVISGSNGVTTLQNSTTVEDNLNWLLTMRGRFGKLAMDNVMVYLTAGAAYGKTHLAFDQRTTGVNCPFGLCSTGMNNTNKTGWTSGAGIEYSVSNHVSVKAEYLYVDLGTISVNSIDSSPENATYLIALPLNANIVRFGLNYKFA
jgi:opacity protein-like surface antigen